MKKLLILSLCMSMLLSFLLAGCTEKPNEPVAPATTDAATLEDVTTAAGTAAETAEEATETSTPETDTNGASDEPNPEPVVKAWPQKVMTFNSRKVESVSIKAGEGVSEQYAAGELQKYFEKMGISVKENGIFPVTVAIDPTMAGESYRIQLGNSMKNGMTITGGDGRGLLYGVYGFLQRYAGVDFYTPELETCSKDLISLSPRTTYEYEPVFELRQIDWYSVRNNPDWCVKNGVNYSHWYGSFSEELGGSWNYGAFVHTLSSLTGTPSDRQPCLTDPEILQKTISSVRAILAANPDMDIISVSQNDNQKYCTCENCRAIDAEEGSPAGTLLRFVNAVAANIAEDYPDVVVDTLAYQYTRKAPSITKPLPNVCIRLCSIECCFAHALSDTTCEVNRDFANDIVEWSKICNRIYIWDYTADFSYYIPTFPNFHVLRDNMRFFAEHNVKGMFPEGNYSSVSGEFGELRAYLLGKLMMDPYMSAGEYYDLMDDFLKAYYGDGWMYLRAYIDYTCGEVAASHAYIRSSPLELIPQEKYEALEETIESWWDKAEAMAGGRLAFVQRSRLQWRYIQLMLHPDEEVAKQFVADVKAAGVYWNEWRTEELPEGANLSKTPDRWDWDF